MVRQAHHERSSDKKTRSRVAVLRPHETLSAYEMSYVTLLNDTCDLKIITVGNSSLGGAWPGVVRLSWPDEIGWKGRRKSLLNAFYGRAMHRRYHIPGLTHHLKDIAIVQALEAANECSYQAARLKEKLGFKLCLSASENQPILEGRSGIELDRVRYTLERVDHAFAISQAASARLVEAGLDPEKVTVIGHGIDCERFAPTVRPERKRMIVGYCGRFRREKGLEHLLSATRDLACDVIVLGDGPEREQLEAAASPSVVFLPPRPYDEIHSFYHEIDAFVLPSVPVGGLVEQFGFVLLEAMASGVPVIASAIGGVPEVVGDAGILVPPGDASALRVAIEELMRDPGRRNDLSRRGLERVRGNFRREDVADKMRRVYQRLLSSRAV